MWRTEKNKSCRKHRDHSMMMKIYLNYWRCFCSMYMYMYIQAQYISFLQREVTQVNCTNWIFSRNGFIYLSIYLLVCGWSIHPKKKWRQTALIIAHSAWCKVSVIFPPDGYYIHKKKYSLSFNYIKTLVIMEWNFIFFMICLCTVYSLTFEYSTTFE
jgi:hypothetical protein